MKNKIFTIIGSILLSVVGFFAALFSMPFGFDHECSGVWSAIAWHCYARQEIIVFLVSLITLMLFRRKYLSYAMIVATYLFIALTFGAYEYNGIKHYTYFEAGIFYAPPSYLGLWVGFYMLMLVFLVNVILIKISSKYKDSGV